MNDDAQGCGCMLGLSGLVILIDLGLLALAVVVVVAVLRWMGVV